MATVAFHVPLHPAHPPRSLVDPERRLHDLLGAWRTLPPRVRQQRLRAVVSHCPDEIPAVDSLYRWLEANGTPLVLARVLRLARSYLAAPAGERAAVVESLRREDATLAPVFSRAMQPVAGAQDRWKRRVGGCA